METPTKKTVTPATKAKSTNTKSTKATKAKTTKARSPKVVKSKADSSKKPVKTLSNLFEDSLKDIFWAEKALTKALPKMVKNATSPDLKKAIENHLEETNTQITRLEEIFKLLGKKAVGKKCDAMEGLIEEGQDIMDETAIGSVRDAGIIAASQKIEHYEIATYGTLYAFATALDEDDVSRLLLLTLEEEKNADGKLTEIALAHINIDAADKNK
ncbi:ferritin-like domain-containing protein [Flavobacterium sp. GT3R68]|uniref:YciE/YciF ferroxidase family protein n=1 Tax=Flavobacterium sp. GT3R68 TaxID=2594437 RepID=UPI000F8975C3|nr:ferritin-like domain-containing protein [Flavobacterium sp. GT3R68]RTY94935.1 ferritin-like domain-containing protein [Flavobacterium sp. GSN2]TRW91739.1 ferritin-like domain-containing protein [Flavobacterium sp. GT3R68]